MRIQRRRSAFDNYVHHNEYNSNAAGHDYSSICFSLSESRTRWVVLLVLPLVMVVWNIAVSRNLMTTTTITWQYLPLEVILGSTDHSDRYNSTTTTTTTATIHTLVHAPLTKTSSDATSTTSLLKSHSIVSTSTTINFTNQSNTLIIGFADDGYKEIAWTWYQELSKLGYTEHMVVAQDISTVAYFQNRGMRHDYIHTTDLQKESLSLYNFTNFRKERCTDYDRKYGNAARRHQIFKRSLFGNRWTYVLRTLQAGTNILLTDVDNVFVRYQDLSELEQEPFDSIHAYAGFISAFPRNIFARTGFTVCGGMSWLRAVPGVIEIVGTLVQRCGCESTLYCHCKCDDQVTLNNIMLADDTYQISWDQSVHKVPTSEEDVRWEEMTGTCNHTNHRVKIWNRNIAFRRNMLQSTERPLICPDPKLNWIAMPSGVDRFRVYDEWRTACPI
jgi:hypothetical protein